MTGKSEDFFVINSPESYERMKERARQIIEVRGRYEACYQTHNPLLDMIVQSLEEYDRRTK